MPEVVVEFFGERWDAPRLDQDEGRCVRQIPTPTGQTCVYCTEPVVDGDRGLMVWWGSIEERGRLRTTRTPVHAECEMRTVMGSPAHLNGTCYCATGRPDPEPVGSYRDEAREVWRIMNTKRSRAGLPPL